MRDALKPEGRDIGLVRRQPIWSIFPGAWLAYLSDRSIKRRIDDWQRRQREAESLRAIERDVVEFETLNREAAALLEKSKGGPGPA